MPAPALTAPLTPRRLSPGWHVVGDVVGMLTVLAVGVVAVRLGQSSATVPVAVSLAAAAAVVAVRRRHPRAALAALALVAVAGLATGGPAVAYLVAGLITVFAVAASADRRTTFVVAVGSAIVASAASLLFPPTGWDGAGDIVQLFVQFGFAAAAGDASRSRRAYIDAVTERARRAEETKESEARRRVAEERLNIARDLHDVVAHQIAVINLHAGVASQALRHRPEDVEQSLTTIRKAARTVLADIASLLTVLRAADTTAGDHRPATVPIPGLAGLVALMAGFAHGGLQIEVREVGHPVELPEAVDVVAYRIIQEALTNAHKHGADGSALLQIEYDNAQVEITVTNTTNTAVPERGASRAGLGLIGAQERVAAVDGTLHTSYGPGPVHRLTARLPIGAVDEQPSLAASGGRLTTVQPGSA